MEKIEKRQDFMSFMTLTWKNWGGNVKVTYITHECTKRTAIYFHQI